VEDQIRIDTPENVSFDYEVSGIGSRFVAALVDHILIALIWLALLFIGLAIVGLTQGNAYVFVAVAASLLLLIVGYYILFEVAWNGQTPGKRLAGLRVLRVDGTPITLVDSLVRNVVRLADFLPAYYGLGVLSMFFSKDTRRLGDFAAGTVVVKERKEVSLESLQASAPAAVPRPAWYPAAPPAGPAADAASPAAAWPIDRLTQADYDLIVDFLRRRHGLGNATELSRRIANALALKLELEQTEYTPLGAELFLEQLEAAYREHVKM